jgi:hypothetical protein
MSLWEGPCHHLASIRGVPGHSLGDSNSDFEVAFLKTKNSTLGYIFFPTVKNRSEICHFKSDLLVLF